MSKWLSMFQESFNETTPDKTVKTDKSTEIVGINNTDIHDKTDKTDKSTKIDNTNISDKSDKTDKTNEKKTFVSFDSFVRPSENSENLEETYNFQNIEWLHLFEERAAIMEFDSGLSRIEAEYQAYLKTLGDFISSKIIQTSRKSLID